MTEGASEGMQDGERVRGRGGESEWGGVVEEARKREGAGESYRVEGVCEREG